VIQLGLMIAALYDLEKDERRVRGGSKLVWVLIIVFLNVIRADHLLRRRARGRVTMTRARAAELAIGRAADETVRPDPRPRRPRPGRPAGSMFGSSARTARARRPPSGSSPGWPLRQEAPPRSPASRPASTGPTSTAGSGYLDQDPRFYAWMRGRELLELTGRSAA
jgi:hypothetical protein